MVQVEPAVAADPGLETPELSIVMPCLNDARTVGTCVTKAFARLQRHDIHGEVIVADNGSTDGSRAIAAGLGARVVPVASRGYGNALRSGIEAARGEFVIMGDSDDSYDFSALEGFVGHLRDGYDLVLGNRHLEHFPFRLRRIRRGRDSGRTRRPGSRPRGGRWPPTRTEWFARRPDAAAPSAWRRASRSG